MNESIEDLRSKNERLKQDALSNALKKNNNRELTATGLFVLAVILIGAVIMTFTPFMQWLAIIGFIYAGRRIYVHVQNKNRTDIQKIYKSPR